MTKIFTSAVFVLGALVSVNAMAGGNIEAGKAAVEKYACASCHGKDLNSPISPDYPKLAGQDKDYISHALLAYQRGDQGANANGRVQPIMAGMAKQLSAQDIQNIGAYVGSLPGSLIVVTQSRFRK
jgi:cytochrome c553